MVCTGNACRSPMAAAILQHRLDIAGHENRQVTRELVEGADLVLGMTRDHVSIAITRSPSARGRTFLVGELARLGAEVGPRGATEPPALWAERAAAARPPRRPLG